jgi:hypothetical protein
MHFQNQQLTNKEKEVEKEKYRIAPRHSKRIATLRKRKDNKNSSIALTNSGR